MDEQNIVNINADLPTDIAGMQLEISYNPKKMTFSVPRQTEYSDGLNFKFRDNHDDLFGFRAVAGLDYLFENQPIDIFLEAGPVFDVAPDFEVRFTAAIGARYSF